MSAVTRRRRPLPRRVYWFRRLLVLALAVGLVVGIARLLGASGVGSADRAAQVAAPKPPGGRAAATSSPGATQAPGAARKGRKAPRHETRQETRQEARQEARQRRKARRPALPEPDGPCLDSDVVVTPVIRTQPAGQRVRVVLKVGTLEAAACSWEVSPESVFVNISSAELGVLWTTQHCGGVVPTRDVVARKEKPARVAFFWGGRESDAQCTQAAPWVTSGSYEVTSVARGSTRPRTSLFVLGPGVAPTITLTPTPTPTPTPSTAEPDATDTEGKRLDRRPDRTN